MTIASFKNLSLDRSLIEAAIQKFASNGGAQARVAEVRGDPDSPSQVAFEISKTGEQPALLLAFFRDDGKTTLNASSGKNQQLSAACAEYVADTCAVREIEQRPMSLDNITAEDWGFLLAHLRDDHGYAVAEEAHKDAERFKVTGAKGDIVYLHRFKTGRFLMQGKALLVYATVSNVLCEIMQDKSEVIQAQLAVHDITSVKTSDLLRELKEHVPSAFEFLGETCQSMIAPSLWLLKAKVELSDYSCVAFPAVRGLEAYLKLLFGKHGYVVKNQAGFGEYFNDERLKSGVSKSINCHATVGAIEKSYVLYNKHRHGLFHADANVEMSRLIDRREEATALVFDVMRNIEETFERIPR